MKIKNNKPEATSTPVKSDGDGASDGENTVRAAGFPYEWTEEQVRSFFDGVGEIAELRLPTWEDSGRIKGYADVKFTSAGSVEKAMALNGKSCGDRWVKVEKWRPPPKRDHTPSEKPEGCNTVFVGNLSWDIDEETLKKAFADCGTVSQIRWGEDKETGDFKGYGHVEFTDSDATDKAVALAGTLVMGRALRVDFAKGSSNSRSPAGGRGKSYAPEQPKPDGCLSIFIGNLSFNLEEDKVWEMFQPCGEISRVKIATDRETGEYRGFGHVEFTESSSVDKAVKLAGNNLCGRPVRIDYAKPKQ